MSKKCSMRQRKEGQKHLLKIQESSVTPVCTKREGLEIDNKDSARWSCAWDNNASTWKKLKTGQMGIVAIEEWALSNMERGFYQQNEQAVHQQRPSISSSLCKNGKWQKVYQNGHSSVDDAAQTKINFNESAQCALCRRA